MSRAIDADALLKKGTMVVWSVQKWVSEVDIAMMPTIEPERKKGKWMRISPAGIYECSECGQNVMTNDICAYVFCHGCGADMRSSEED